MSGAGHLSPQQFTWEEITARHPDLEEHDYAVNHLGNATAADPEAMNTTADDLTYHYRGVDPQSVSRPTVLSPERQGSAYRGYHSGAQMPPVLLVQRNAASKTLHIADGNHRVAAGRAQEFRSAAWSKEHNSIRIPAIIGVANTKGRLPKKQEW